MNATEKSNVQEFGWIEAEDGCFIPDKCLTPVPRYFTAKCGCKKVCFRRCHCSLADIKNGLSFVPAEQLVKMHKNNHIKTWEQ